VEIETDIKIRKVKFQSASDMDFGVFTLLQTPSELNDLASVAEHIRGMSDIRRSHAAGWRSLSFLLEKLVVSENPAASDDVEIMVRLFARIADAEGALAESEFRAAEDLRDIVERYNVIFLCDEAYSEASNIFDFCCLELRAAVADERENAHKQAAHFKYTAAIEKAKDDKRQAVAGLKAAITRMIEMRERYAAFRGRRMAHAGGRSLRVRERREAAVRRAQE
jgi:hypothetical protein